MATVFGERKGVLTVEFMQQETIIMSQIYCETLKSCVRSTTWNKRCGMLTSGLVLLHDNARLSTSTAAHTQALLEHFNWQLFDHPLYSPDLTPIDYHLFTYLKNWLGSQHFSYNEKLMEGVKMWLSSKAADFFDTGIQKLIPQYKCLSSGGDYIEK
jgi:hypothetical protein